MARETTWSALVCPDCRFVFRIPAGQDGHGVVCPCCERFLRVPGPGDVVPTLVVPMNRDALLAEARGRRKRRRRRKPRKSEDSWQSEERKKGRAGSSRRMVIWQMVLAMVLLAVTVFLIARVIHTKPEGGMVVSAPLFGGVDSDVPAMPEAPVEAGLDQVTTFDEDELRSLAQKFLDAGSVEDLLPLVRHREELEGKIRAHYQESPLVAPGFREVAVIQTIREGGFSAALMGLTTKDFGSSALAVVGTAEGLRVDWESWVGSGDMSWTEFFETKPTEPVAMRVLLSDLSYYNGMFSDDQKWKSFRITPADGQETLYGYSNLESELTDELSRLIRNSEQPDPHVILEMSYPEGAVAPRQVLIHKLIDHDWLVPDKNHE